jgi:uncharacterized protein with GYD domain
METYVVLINYSGSAQEVDFDRPRNPEKETAAMLEAVGGKLLHVWTTLGRFDVILVAEVPDVRAIRAVVAAFPKEVRSETMRAFPGISAASDADFESKLKKVLATVSPA